MRFHSFLLSAMLCGALTAQVPQAFDFQAVARDASGNVLSAQALSVRLSVHSGTAGGAIAYQESHAVTTNAFGLFSVAVGQGSTVQGVFADVAWGAAPHFLHVELDASGGSNYVDMGTTQLLSVPYALHAGGVDCATVSLLGDTLKQANGCFVIIPGLSAANGGCLDVDNDGFYNNAGCPPLDCNDANALVNPGATELCGNGTDDDCDGVVDNNTDPSAFVLFYADADGDGFGNAAISVSGCTQPAGHVTNDTDCDDSNASLFPGQGCSLFCSPAEATWVDQNQAFLFEQADVFLFSCFGAPDPAACLADELAAGGQVPLGAICLQCLADRYSCIVANCVVACVQGGAACEACIAAAGCDVTFLQCMGIADSDGDGWADGSDCNDADATIHPLAPEMCDAIDNDCDGLVDEGNVCCPDNDGDNFSTCDGDCDDNNSEISPEATEVCDVQDNDCDGLIDEDNVCDCLDQDLDGFTTCDGDCDDSNFNINPGASELCGDGLDNDCDGTVDNTTTWFEDLDEDGFGNPGSTVDACEQPSGFVADGNDCNDLDPDVFPLAGPGTGCSSCSPADRQWMDDNYLSLWNTTGVAVGECQGLTGQAAWDCLRTHIQPFVPIGPTCLQCALERAFTVLGGCSTQCSPWLLSDGVVAGSVDCNLCSITNGVHAAFAACSGVVDQDGDGVPASVDCNDNNAAIRPGVEDICDGLDNDCDGQVDEGCLPEVCDGVDNDGDGLTDAADPGLVLVPCENQIGVCGGVQKSNNLCVGGTWLTCATSDYTIGSPAYETTESSCDTQDNDCDGQVDEDNVCNPCTDNDADGFTTCQGDCNDNNANIRPGAIEVCNGVDDDCDGQVDEGGVCP